MTQPPEWLDELPLRPGPPWHLMGTRSTGDAAAWLVVTGDDDREREAQLTAKRAILADPATRRQAVVRFDGPTVARAEAAVASLVAPGTEDLVAAASAVPEDVCVLVRRDGGWRFDSGVVCFPSIWRPADKIGRPVADIHDPVPGYAEELGDRVDRLLDRLRPDRPLWRRNWFVHRSPVLHQPEAAPDEGPEIVPDGFWVRTERQGLRRVEPSNGTAAAVFTIRTQVAPLTVVRHRANVARAMAAALRSWPDELVSYRRAGGWRDAVAEWLDAVARA